MVPIVHCQVLPSESAEFKLHLPNTEGQVSKVDVIDKPHREENNYVLDTVMPGKVYHNLSSKGLVDLEAADYASLWMLN